MKLPLALALLGSALLMGAAPASAFTYTLLSDDSCKDVMLMEFTLLPASAACKPVTLVAPDAIAMLKAGWRRTAQSNGDCMTNGYSMKIGGVSVAPKPDAKKKDRDAAFTIRCKWSAPPAPRKWLGTVDAAPTQAKPSPKK